MWKNSAERGRSQMPIRRMRFEFRTPEAKNTISEYLILIAVPLQQWLHEHVSLLRYTLTVL